MRPTDFQHEALDTLPDRPVFRPDGSFYTTGRPDSIFLTLRAQEFENSMKAMSEAATRWSTAFVPEITAFEPIKGGEITPEQQRAEAVKDAVQRVGVSDTTAEQLTQRITQEQAEADRRAAEGLKHYL